MIHSGKVASCCISMFVVSDVKEVAAKSVCYCVLGLSNVLFPAGFAGNAVNKVGTLATDVVFASGVFFPVMVHLNLSSFLRSGQNWHFALEQSLFCMLVL